MGHEHISTTLEKYANKPAEQYIAIIEDSGKFVRRTGMNYVEQIRSRKDVTAIEEYLKLRNKRNRLIFVFGIFNDVAVLQNIFRHSSPSITLKYIAISQEEIDSSYNSFELNFF